MTLTREATDDPRIAIAESVAGHDPDALIAAHGSPLYVYDLDVHPGACVAAAALRPGERRRGVRCQVESRRLPCSPHSPRKGSGPTSHRVASSARSSGRDSTRHASSSRGPARPTRRSSAALRSGVGALTIESPDEIDAILAMAPDVAPGQGLLLRLSTLSTSEPDPIISAMGIDKFGLTEDEADELLERLRTARALGPEGPYVVRGFHAFAASNVRDAATLVSGVADLATRAERLADRHRIAISLLDAGGGLGIPYADDESPLDVGRLGELLAAEIDTWRDRPTLAGARVLIEPGRWLVGPAGAYICRVVRTKVRAGRTIAVTDGGIHHLLRPRLVGRDHRVVPVGDVARRDAGDATNVVGPLCTGLDVLATDVRLPAVERGDLLAILDAGAYGYSESMPFFLSHPIPAEVVIDARHRARVTRADRANVTDGFASTHARAHGIMRTCRKPSRSVTSMMACTLVYRGVPLRPG